MLANWTLIKNLEIIVKEFVIYKDNKIGIGIIKYTKKLL